MIFKSLELFNKDQYEFSEDKNTIGTLKNVVDMVYHIFENVVANFCDLSKALIQLIIMF